MGSLGRLSRFLRPYRAWVIAAPVFMIFEVALDLAQPRLLQKLIDHGLPTHDQALVIHLGLIMIACAVLGAATGVGCTWAAVQASMRFGADLREGLFRQIQALSFGNLDRLEVGPLVTRLTNDCDQVQMMIRSLLRIMIRAPLLVLGSFIMAVITSPRLSLLILGLGPLLILILSRFIRSAHAAFTRQQARLDRVNAVGLENLSGVRVVKAFVRAEHEVGRFTGVNDDFMTHTIHAQVLVAAVMPLMTLVANAGIVGVLWFGGLQVKAATMEVGQILAFVNYLTLMLNSLGMVGMLITRVVSAEASAQRIEEVLDTTPEITDPAGTRPTAVADWSPVAGAVAFEEVTFRYHGSRRRAALRDVSFSAPAGSLVAIVGPTGAGKSTLVNLIPRLYDVAEGAVRIDGHDLRDLAIADLRREVAVVLQETVLFSGSIADNLRFARPEASDDELVEAARIAQAHEFITGFEEGYETVLGQRGVNISGGQKQRLSIARALVAKPAVLIFDGCTSALDASTEVRLFADLQAWGHPCTRFVVTHRLGPILGADQILVMEHGQLLAAGTHEQLLATSPIWQAMVETQLNGRVLADG